jgi:GGDEF domain-containing protein
MLGKRVPGGVATLLKWAKSNCALDHAKLRKLYIFSPDGIAPTPRWKLDHWLRLAVESLRLSFTIRRDDGSTVTKWFTSHWFRHVFVNRMLDRIAESSLSDAGRDNARSKLASYMGWKNPAGMLVYYGRYHFEQEVNQLVTEHQDDLNAEMTAVFGDEDHFDAANDNTFWPSGRVVGGDLLD